VSTAPSSWQSTWRPFASWEPGGVVAATITAQLIVSAILDAAGVLGLERVSLSPTRLLGVAALIVGTALVTLR
jgi:uncharacterized membrane protein YdcZ (DUF606 family)